MVTTPTAFVAVMAGVGDSPNSDFSDEHAERKRHDEMASVVTARSGLRNIFIPDFYLKVPRLSNCQSAGTRSREASEPDVSAPQDWFLICDGICTGAANFPRQILLRKNFVAGSSL